VTVKSTLKSVKLNESLISMVLGAIVIIAAGMLILNFFKNDNSTKSTLSTADLSQNTGELNNSNTNSEKTHTVQNGETLWQIAEKYYNDGYKWTEIAKANNLNNDNAISAGQELKIPELKSDVLADSSKNISPTATPTVTVSVKPTETVSPTPTEDKEVTQSSEAINGATYTVEKGDSLWKIAVRAYGDGYKWTEIAKANNLKDPNVIHPGNVFTLPR
jgi:nucleoid-associated protein YgaU